MNNKKSKGHHGICSKTVKYFAPVLADHLAHFFNICFKNKCYPNFLKIAKTIPLHKNGDKTEPDNHRPFSLLSYKSTHAILSISDFFRESIDNKKFGYSCFIDLKKAFDTTDQKILLDKLYRYVFRGKIHKLMTNFLTGRNKYVYSNQSVLNMRECTKGVPQG